MLSLVITLKFEFLILIEVYKAFLPSIHWKILSFWRYNFSVLTYDKLMKLYTKGGNFWKIKNFNLKELFYSLSKDI